MTRIKWSVPAICLVVATALAYTTKQSTDGQKLFSQSCAVCHGDKGQGAMVPSKFGNYAGMHAPELIGSNSLPGFHNAGHIFSFIQTAMPLDKPGSLSRKEYIDLTAYLVHANNFAKPDGEPMTPQSASKVTFSR